MSTVKRFHIGQLQPYFTTDAGIRRIARARSIDPDSLTVQTSAVQPTRQKKLRVIAKPQSYIACVILAKNGQLDNHDRELLYVTHVLSHKWQDCAVVAVVFGQVEQDLHSWGEWGADQLVRIAYDPLQHYQPQLMLEQLETAIEPYNPRHVLFADNDWGGGDLLRRLAARTNDAELATDVIEITQDRVTRLIDNQRQQASHQLPRLIGLCESVSESEPDSISEIQEHYTQPQQQPATAKVHKLRAGDIPLEQARLVMSLGNGVSDVTAFVDCAQALDATVGGSRVVVDEGKLPRECQVGATGKSTSASVYLAFGISGAVQHLEGIKKCGTVIAINTDQSCAMVSRADHSYINDAVEVLKALTEIATTQKQRSTAA